MGGEVLGRGEVTGAVTVRSPGNCDDQVQVLARSPGISRYFQVKR